MGAHTLPDDGDAIVARQVLEGGASGSTRLLKDHRSTLRPSIDHGRVAAFEG